MLLSVSAVLTPSESLCLLPSLFVIVGVGAEFARRAEVNTQGGTEGSAPMGASFVLTVSHLRKEITNILTYSLISCVQTMEKV